MLIVLVTSRCKDVSGFDVIWATDWVGSPGQRPSGRVSPQKSWPSSISGPQYSYWHWPAFKNTRSGWIICVWILSDYVPVPQKCERKMFTLVMPWLQLLFDYDLTATCHARVLPIQRKRKMNMSIFRRSRITVESNAYRNFDHFRRSRMRCGIVVS